MADPRTQAQTQLRNVENATGMTVADFADAVRGGGLERHGEIVAFLKSKHGLGHGNANLVAKLVREQLAGGPPLESQLLEAQYAGAKAQLRPIADELVAYARSLGDDVTVVVQKTAVSLRRARQFGVFRAPSSKRVELGLNLPDSPPTDRLILTSGMCSRKVDLASVDEIDDEVVTWLCAAFERAH